MTVAYFFNCGCLGGDDVLMELLYVLTTTKLVVIKDYGQLLDTEGRGGIGAIPLLIKGKCNSFKEGIPNRDHVQ